MSEGLDHDGRCQAESFRGGYVFWEHPDRQKEKVKVEKPEEDLVIWTIYDHPKDFPEGFIVRPWTIGPGDAATPGQGYRATSLEAARQFVPAGLYRMDRQPDDDPAILESWI